MKKGSNLDEGHLYENCWNRKWKCNLINLEQWLDIFTIFFSFLARKNITKKSQISILLLMLLELKLILVLQMHKPICERCW